MGILEFRQNSVIAREQSDRSNPIQLPETPVIASEQSDRSNPIQLPETPEKSHPELTFDEWRAAESTEWQARFDEAARLLDIGRSTDRTMAMLEPLFAKRASQNPHIMLKGQLRFGFDGNPY